MAIGPGKYDEITEWLRKNDPQAQAIFICVVRREPNGFSTHHEVAATNKAALAILPEALLTHATSLAHDILDGTATFTDEKPS